jgi:hypothetical protein
MSRNPHSALLPSATSSSIIFAARSQEVQDHRQRKLSTNESELPLNPTSKSTSSRSICITQPVPGLRGLPGQDPRAAAPTLSRRPAVTPFPLQILLPRRPTEKSLTLFRRWRKGVSSSVYSAPSLSRRLLNIVPVTSVQNAATFVFKTVTPSRRPDPASESELPLNPTSRPTSFRTICSAQPVPRLRELPGQDPRAPAALLQRPACHTVMPSRHSHPKSGPREVPPSRP